VFNGKCGAVGPEGDDLAVPTGKGVVKETGQSLAQRGIGLGPERPFPVGEMFEPGGGGGLSRAVTEPAGLGDRVEPLGRIAEEGLGDLGGTLGTQFGDESRLGLTGDGSFGEQSQQSHESLSSQCVSGRSDCDGEQSVANRKLGLRGVALHSTGKRV
jgi:hypothetical protein